MQTLPSTARKLRRAGVKSGLEVLIEKDCHPLPTHPPSHRPRSSGLIAMCHPGFRAGGGEGKSASARGMVYALFCFCGAFTMLVKIFLSQSTGGSVFITQLGIFLLCAAGSQPLSQPGNHIPCRARAQSSLPVTHHHSRCAPRSVRVTHWSGEHTPPGPLVPASLGHQSPGRAPRGLPRAFQGCGGLWRLRPACHRAAKGVLAMTGEVSFRQALFRAPWGPLGEVRTSVADLHGLRGILSPAPGGDWPPAKVMFRTKAPIRCGFRGKAGPTARPGPTLPRDESVCSFIPEAAPWAAEPGLRRVLRNNSSQ